jgi:hypothetical protein
MHGFSLPMANTVAHRLVVTERSDVLLELDGLDDADPSAVYVRSGCADPAAPIACGERQARFTAEPGEYTVLVAGNADGEVMSLKSFVTPMARVERACANALPLVPGTPTTSTTSSGNTNALAGSCDGAGAPERVFRFDVSEPSRVRCSVTPVGAAPLLVHLRTNCADFASERDCGALSGPGAAAHVPAGPVFAIVDGRGPRDRADFELYCDTLTDAAVSASPPPADRCAAPGTIDVASGSGTATYELFRAGASPELVCATHAEDAPDQLYRFVLGAPSQVSVRAGGDDVRLGIAAACGARTDPWVCSPGTLDRVLGAGPHLLLVDGAFDADGTVTVTTTPAARICAGAAELVPGEVTWPSAGNEHYAGGSCTEGNRARLYSFRLDRRAHVELDVGLPEWRQSDVAVTIYAGCFEREVHCQRITLRAGTITQTLEPGPYLVAVEDRGNLRLELGPAP